MILSDEDPVYTLFGSPGFAEPSRHRLGSTSGSWSMITQLFLSLMPQRALGNCISASFHLTDGNTCACACVAAGECSSVEFASCVKTRVHGRVKTRVEDSVAILGIPGKCEGITVLGSGCVVSLFCS